VPPAAWQGPEDKKTATQNQFTQPPHTQKY
jgi:hypothetical protein